MEDIFYKVQSQLNSGYPFAIYRKPGQNVITGIFQKDSAAYTTKNFSETGFVLAPFAGGNTILLPLDKCEIIARPVKHTGNQTGFINGWPVSSVDKTTFENLVQDAVSAIQNNEFEKVVLSRKEVLETNINIIGTYKNMMQAYKAAFTYCFYHPDAGLWMGATPEQLLKVEDNIIYTVALAGTQLYSDKKKVVWQDKEKQEQQFVADYIVKSITPYTDSIKISDTYTHQAGSLLHIKTDISAELKETHTTNDIVQALHPTPAICGMPKQEAYNFIVKYENYNREFYSGFLGEINFKDFGSSRSKTDLFVNLRCMKVDAEKVNLFIGCGITSDSNPESEFFETVNKSLTMKNILQIESEV